MTIIDTHAAYLGGTSTPSGCIEQVLARIAAADRPEIWISRVDDDALRERAGCCQVARHDRVGVMRAIVIDVRDRFRE